MKTSVVLTEYSLIFSSPSFNFKFWAVQERRKSHHSGHTKQDKTPALCFLPSQSLFSVSPSFPHCWFWQARAGQSNLGQTGQLQSTREGTVKEFRFCQFPVMVTSITAQKGRAVLRDLLSTCKERQFPEPITHPSTS